MSTQIVQREFNPKNMLFRRLGPSGLRVPLFSLGGCMSECRYMFLVWWTFNVGLTLGGTVTGDPVKVIGTSNSISLDNDALMMVYRTLLKPPSMLESICSTLQRHTPVENQSERCRFFHDSVSAKCQNKGLFKGTSDQGTGAPPYRFGYHNETFLGTSSRTKWWRLVSQTVSFPISIYSIHTDEFWRVASSRARKRVLRGWGSIM